MSPDNPLLTDPMAIFAFLAGVLALIFWLSGLPALKKVFDITPPVIYAYFIPTLATTIGITPMASPTYGWMVGYLLPLALLLLMVTIDLPAIMRLGGLALVMMLAGTLGIVIGGPVAFLAVGHWLPEGSWTALAALSGSWIGGTANMTAIAGSVGTPPELLGPIIVVDTVVGYGWMGILLFFSGFQKRFDAHVGAHSSAMDAVTRHVEELEERQQPLNLRFAAIIVGLGFAATVAAVMAGRQLPALGDPTIISTTTWGILIVVTAGLLLSFTRMRTIEDYGASRIGYLALYLVLTAIGAQANMRAVLDAPAFLLAGVIWISIHVLILYLAARIFKAPLFFVATGSMANVGGAASAPVVAGAYNPALAPVGLLMAVGGYILGIYAALGCAWMLGVLGT